ncbi:unnamed protein product [Ambrosiozyma monospora]|uniref:Unnamed protein product n=1 Tax=Ambrosiozyma monospora TaxID=43982 RepID=A0ACB5T4Q3_AMBMO|nr:unnamed protein product [Ambrosiozyma monospora]
MTSLNNGNDLFEGELTNDENIEKLIEDKSHNLSNELNSDECDGDKKIGRNGNDLISQALEPVNNIFNILRMCPEITKKVDALDKTLEKKTMKIQEVDEILEQHHTMLFVSLRNAGSIDEAESLLEERMNQSTVGFAFLNAAKYVDLSTYFSQLWTDPDNSKSILEMICDVIKLLKHIIDHPEKVFTFSSIGFCVFMQFTYNNAFFKMKRTKYSNNPQSKVTYTMECRYSCRSNNIPDRNTDSSKDMPFKLTLQKKDITCPVQYKAVFDPRENTVQLSYAKTTPNHTHTFDGNKGMGYLARTPPFLKKLILFIMDEALSVGVTQTNVDKFLENISGASLYEDAQQLLSNNSSI